MQTKPRYLKSSQGGFTLIEIVVVVFVIGLMVGVSVIRMGGNTTRVALLEAKRFIHIVNEVQDLAVLSGKPYALAFDESTKSYEFLANPPQWQSVNDGELFKQRQFPESITMVVDVEKIENSVDEIINDDSGSSLDFSSEGLLSDNDEDGSKERLDISPNLNQVLISPLSGVSPFTLNLSTDDVQLQIRLNEEQRLETIKL